MAVREIGARLTADASQFTREMKAVDSNLALLNKELKANQAEFQASGNAADYLTTQQALLTDKVAQSAVKVDALQAAYDEAAASLPELAAAAAKAAEEFGKDSAQAQAAAKAYNNADVEATKLAKKLADARTQYAQASAALQQNTAAVEGNREALSSASPELQRHAREARRNAAVNEALEKAAAGAGAALRAGGRAALAGAELVARGTAAMAAGAVAATGALAVLAVSGIKTVTDYAVEAANATGPDGQPLYAQYTTLAQNLSGLETAVGGAKAALGGILLPMLESLSAEGAQYLNDFSAAMADASGDTEAMGQVIGDFVTRGVDLIADKLPEYMKLGGQLLSSLGSGIEANLPEIMDGATEILNTLLQGVRDAAPILGEAGLAIVMTLLQFLMDNAPELLTAGLDLITQVVEGLSEAGPELNAAALQIVETLLTWVVENAPQLISGGAQLLTSVVTGVANHIPDLIPKAVEAVGTLLNTLIDNAPDLLAAGIALFVQVAIGLAQELPNLILAAVDAISSLVSDLVDKAADAYEIGSEFVAKIMEGISKKWEELKTWASNIWESFKSIFETPVNISINGRSNVSGSGYAGANRVQAFATGLNYVPYDEFPAYLHRGEAVLTASEANDWRAGRSGKGSTIVNNFFVQEMTDAQVQTVVRVVNEELGRDV